MHSGMKKIRILMAVQAVSLCLVGCGNSVSVDVSLGGQNWSAESFQSSDADSEGSLHESLEESLRESETLAETVSSEEATFSETAASSAAAASSEEAASSAAVASSTTVASSEMTVSSEVLPQEENKSARDYKISKKYGSAKDIKGKTLVVSIFAEEKNTDWNWEDEEDLARYSKMYYSLQDACDWLEEQCHAYGAESEFLCDWMKYSDLYYKASFTESLIREDGSGYKFQKNWVTEHVDSEGLLEKYDADNLIFAFFIDSDPEEAPNPWTLSMSCGEMCQIEICNFFVRYNNKYTVEPNTMAHELLHCFEAPDLYVVDDDYITQEYVNHLRKTKSQDIMYMIYDSEEISEKFTELDAYYVGLIDSCDEVEEWGLGKSFYQR